MLIYDDNNIPKHKEADAVLEQKHEADQRVEEKLKRETDTIQKDGDFITSNAEGQRGRQMHSLTVETKLKKLNPNLQFDVAIADWTKIGIYLIESGLRKRYLGIAMENGMMPEFSIRVPELQYLPNKYGEQKHVNVFEREIRGWRTVLMRLIKQRLITKEDAEKEFDIAGGRSSYLWQATTGGTLE